MKFIESQTDYDDCGSMREILTYEQRLKTFDTWPIGLKQSKHDLAKDGFIYTNKSDIVECCYCKIQLCQWLEDDIPSEEHRKYSKRCPSFVNEEEYSNYDKRLESFMTNSYLRSIAQDGFYLKDNNCVCFSCNLSLKPRDFLMLSNDSKFASKLHAIFSNNCSYLRMCFGDKFVLETRSIYFCDKVDMKKEIPCEFPQYDTPLKRLKTYDTWPIEKISLILPLLLAGYYYTHRSDVVCCFSCGMCLYDSSQYRKPIVEHKIRSPYCSYAKMFRYRIKF